MIERANFEITAKVGNKRKIYFAEGREAADAKAAFLERHGYQAKVKQVKGPK